MPRPSQCGQGRDEPSSRPGRSRCRDISMQAEMADPAHLNAGAVILERIFQAPLDRAVVAVLLHVDEVDDHKAGKIAQPQLPGDFVAGFKVGLERRVFDIVFARRLAGVDVDRKPKLPSG